MCAKPTPRCCALWIWRSNEPAMNWNNSCGILPILLLWWLEARIAVIRQLSKSYPC